MLNNELDPIKKDMRALYDQLRDGHIELKKASELANIAGKYLKAVQLDLAERIFLENITKPTPQQPAIEGKSKRLKAA